MKVSNLVGMGLVIFLMSDQSFAQNAEEIYSDDWKLSSFGIFFGGYPYSYVWYREPPTLEFLKKNSRLSESDLYDLKDIQYYRESHYSSTDPIKLGVEMSFINQKRMSEIKTGISFEENSDDISYYRSYQQGDSIISRYFSIKDYYEMLRINGEYFKFSKLYFEVSILNADFGIRGKLGLGTEINISTNSHHERTESVTMWDTAYADLYYPNDPISSWGQPFYFSYDNGIIESKPRFLIGGNALVGFEVIVKKRIGPSKETFGIYWQYAQGIGLQQIINGSTDMKRREFAQLGFRYFLK